MVVTKALGAALLGGLVLAACSRSAEPRSTPEFAEPPAAVQAPAPVASAAPTSTAGEDELATIEQAEAALERARADLDRLALNDAVPAGAAAGAPVPAAPAPPPATRASPSSADLDVARDKKGKSAARSRASAPKAAEVEAEAPAEPQAKSENPCETGCKAFASLLRAKSAVCRLDAPGGSRCSRAEDIAREAQSRVRSCACQQ